MTLSRKTPMRRSIFPRGGSHLLGLSPLRQQSARRQRQAREYATKKKTHMEANPLCVVCGRPATDLDHKANRSQSASAFLDETNFQSLCAACHTWKTTHPAEAEAAGFATSGWQYRKDVA